MCECTDYTMSILQQINDETLRSACFALRGNYRITRSVLRQIVYIFEHLFA